MTARSFSMFSAGLIDRGDVVKLSAAIGGHSPRNMDNFRAAFAERLQKAGEAVRTEKPTVHQPQQAIAADAGSCVQPAEAPSAPVGDKALKSMIQQPEEKQGGAFSTATNWAKNLFKGEGAVGSLGKQVDEGFQTYKNSPGVAEAGSAWRGPGGIAERASTMTGAPSALDSMEGAGKALNAATRPLERGKRVWHQMGVPAVGAVGSAVAAPFKAYGNTMRQAFSTPTPGNIGKAVGQTALGAGGAGVAYRGLTRPDEVDNPVPVAVPQNMWNRLSPEMLMMMMMLQQQQQQRAPINAGNPMHMDPRVYAAGV